VLTRLLGGLGVAIAAGGCSWFTDFKEQPKIDPWETPADTIPFRANPQTSVPIYGSAAPGYAYDRAPTIAAVEAMAGIPNPVPADTRSLNNGRMQFQINCAVCHGSLGHGDGPATRFGMAGISLVTDVTKNRTDGYIFGMIRNGRGLMPTYNRIEEPDRWDVVNYLRALQGRYGAAPDTAHGRPGETGALVPGASVTAPTRPAPFYGRGTDAGGAAADTARARPSTDTTGQRRQP
jgi:mono/diheme cytochrome c family protein